MKKIISFILLSTALLAWGASQTPPVYTVEVRTDRPDAMYKQGEKAVFYFTVKEGGKPLEGANVLWRVTKDGAEPFIDSGSMALEKGTGSVSGTLDEPGFLQCRVDFKTPEGKNVGYRAGAAYDPLEIKASRPLPADFDEFWNKQKEALKKLPLNLKLTPVENQSPDVVSYDVQADCGDGHISAFLSIPTGAKPGTCPAIITLHGAGVRDANLSRTRAWAKEGFIAFDFNVHGLPNGKPASYYSDLYKTDLKDYFNKNRDNRDTHYYRGLYMRLMRSIDILTQRPEWDGKVLVAHGPSQGGAQSFAAAGLDPRVTLFCAEIPALCDLTGVAVGRVNGWPTNRYGWPNPQNKPSDMTEAELSAAQYFDSANFATRTKAEALVTVGYADPVCPPTTVYAAYNNIPGTNKRMLIMPLVEHRSTPESLATVKQTIIEHARKLKATEK